MRCCIHSIYGRCRDDVEVIRGLSDVMCRRHIALACLEYVAYEKVIR